MFPASPAPNDSFVVRPRGRLNMAVAPHLRQALTDHARAGKHRLVVDLGEVESIDSAALAALISGLKVARRADGDLRIVAPSKYVAEVMRLTRLDALLPAYGSIATAFAS